VTAALALDLRSVTKRFGSVAALSGASLAATAGSLHVLLGENGAGKTTLLRVASGFLRADSGEVLVQGVQTHWRSRAQALRAGVAVVEQHFSLVPAMTVAENVALSADGPFAWYSPTDAASRVVRIAQSVGLQVDPHAVVATLSVAAQQRAEIVKALASDASLLILDEPTAVLTPAESDELFTWLRAFVASGRTAVVITHRIREALQHGDALTVLREGRTVLQAGRGEVSREVLISAIMGSGTSPTVRPTPQAAASAGEVVASLRSVSVTGLTGVPTLREVTTEIRRGEIVGVAGVEGSGQRELLRVLAGRLVPSSGTVMAPAQVAFIPEDRHHDALIGEMSLSENLALQGIGSRRGRIDWTAVARETRAAVAAYSVRAESEHQAAGTLSGGNQQKFVLARELSNYPALIVAENPTRGLDVRAAADVMTQLMAARGEGSSVILYSSDVEDLVGFADRVLVCYAGSVASVSNDLTSIGNAMLGVR
jgi:ABC-type uncharacterized transport system ATPase subunit